MRDCLRIMAALAQTVGDGREFLGGVFGQRLTGLGGLQPFRVCETGAQQVSLFV